MEHNSFVHGSLILPQTEPNPICSSKSKLRTMYRRPSELGMSTTPMEKESEVRRSVKIYLFAYIIICLSVCPSFCLYLLPLQFLALFLSYVLLIFVTFITTIRIISFKFAYLEQKPCLRETL